MAEPPYPENFWKDTVAEANRQVDGYCYLAEDVAIIWADDTIKKLREEVKSQYSEIESLRAEVDSLREHSIMLGQICAAVEPYCKDAGEGITTLEAVKKIILKSQSNRCDVLKEAYAMGYVHISGFYADMTNPNNRGSNWSWDRFVDLALTRVEHGFTIQNITLDADLYDMVVSDLSVYANSLVVRGGWFDDQTSVDVQD